MKLCDESDLGEEDLVEQRHYTLQPNLTLNQPVWAFLSLSMYSKKESYRGIDRFL